MENATLLPTPLPFFSTAKPPKTLITTLLFTLEGRVGGKVRNASIISHRHDISIFWFNFFGNNLLINWQKRHHLEIISASENDNCRSGYLLAYLFYSP